MSPEAQNLWGPLRGKVKKEDGDMLLVDNIGNEVGNIYECAVWERILAESRALAGCPDPEAFVKAVKATVETAVGGNYEGATKLLHEHPALAWLREKA